MTGVKIPLTVAVGRLKVVSRAAQKALPKIVEEMPREEHVYPGVTATVETGEQHGDDEGHGCTRGHREETQLLRCDNTDDRFI